MDCDKIKDLLMTDYIDGRLSGTLYEQVRAHLKACKQCSQFEQTLLHTVKEPFAGLSEIPPPDSVWENIREDIIRAEEARSKGILAGLKDYLQGLFRLPRPAFAFAAALLIFIITAGITNLALYSRKTVNVYVQEQGDFLSSLDTGEENPLSMSTAGLDSALEEYFL